MIVISDATPLISLMKADCLDILQSIFDRVMIPEAVYNELTSNKTYREEAELIAKADFINVVQLVEKCIANTFQQKTGLDRGESEAIVYADEQNADILLMDEAAGRKVAMNMGLTITGSIGILIKGYRQKLLTRDELETAINDIRLSNRHISENLLNMALNMADTF